MTGAIASAPPPLAAPPSSFAPEQPVYNGYESAYAASPLAARADLTPAAREAPAALTPPGKFIRWLGHFIDGVLGIVLVFLVLIPFIGGLVPLLYWLLRDIRGASLGKSLVGTRIVNQAGRTPDRQALIMRNAIFALPWLFSLVPFLGGFLAGFVAFIVALTEALLVLFTDRRLGDRLAGTYVVNR